MNQSILKVVHEAAKGLYKAGLMSTKKMQAFDVMCLPSMSQLRPQKIKLANLHRSADEDDVVRIKEKRL